MRVLSAATITGGRVRPPNTSFSANYTSVVEQISRDASSVLARNRQVTKQIAMLSASKLCSQILIRERRYPNTPLASTITPHTERLFHRADKTALFKDGIPDEHA